MMRISRALLLIVLATVTLWFGACAGSAADRDRLLMRDPALSAEDDLSRLAQLEAQLRSPVLREATIPLPPGIDASLLEPRDAADPKAFLPLDEALAEIVKQTDISTTGAERDRSSPAPDAEQKNEALRHYIRGRAAALAGEHLVAITELEQAHKLDPTSTAVMRELAHSYAALPSPNTGKVLAIFQQLAGIDELDSEALFALGWSAANHRDFDRAAALLARRRLALLLFDHDAAAEPLANFALHIALVQLGYDRASIEAGRAALELDFPFHEPTFYRQHVAALYSQRAGIRQAMGDAYCRLGEFARALEAYTAAAELPMPDASSLHPRVIYANLLLGRPFAAQQEMLAALKSAAPSVSDLDIRLCGYLVSHVDRREAIIEAAGDLLAEHPDEPSLVRAVAQLLPVHRAGVLLRDFLRRRPGDMQILGELLSWMADRDSAGSVDLVASLVSEAPQHADDCVQRLIPHLPNPVGVADSLTVPEGAGHAQVRARLLTKLWALGEAWAACRDGLERWPEDEGLHLLQIELAGLLDEPPLVDDAIAQAAAMEMESTWSWIVRARALRQVEQYDRAIQAAETALLRARELGDPQITIEPLLELSRVRATTAAPMPINDDRRAMLRSAIDAAEQARAIAPERDEPYELLLTLHGPSGLITDARSFQQLAAQLREANPGSRFLQHMIISEAIQRGQHEWALERALSLYDGEPADARALLLAISAWQGLDRASEAEQWLREQVARRPGDPALLEQLVRLMLHENRAEAARQLLQQRLDAGSDDHAARRLLELVLTRIGETESAVALGERRLTARPEGTRRALELAALYSRAGLDEKTAEQLQWIADNASLASLEHFTGALSLETRLKDQGEPGHLLTAHLVDATIEQYPDAPLVVYFAGLRAIVQLDDADGRFDDLARRAASDAREASNSTIQGALPWRDLAQRLVDLDQPAAASSALRTRLNCGHKLDIQATSLLTSMMLAADAGCGGRVAASIDMLAELDARGDLPVLPGMQQDAIPTLASALMAASNIYTLLGDSDGAERLLRETIRLDPANAMAMNNLGYSRIEAGHSDEQTTAWIERAAELITDDASVLDSLAWLYYKQGRPDDDGDQPGAVSLLQRVVEMNEAGDEPSAEVLDHLGDALWRSGRRSEAADAWRRAVELLEEPERRQRIIQNYMLLQSQGWGLLVSDPKAMYDRDFGAVLERARRKLSAVEQDGDPPVAPTFAELSPSR